MFPPKERLTIGFAHAAYRMQERFELRRTGVRSFEVRTRDELDRRIGEADVLLASGLWRNDLIDRAPKLRFIQSISAGMDQYSRASLAARGIRLASAQGVNARAVAEHAIAFILALSRRFGEARDNQAKRFWRGMIGDPAGREDELSGKTLLIIGLGRIGGRLAQLGKAFDLRVLGIRRDPTAGSNGADAVHGLDRLKELLPRADFVALTCALTPETEGLLSAEALACMKRSAFVINVARGRCVDEPALVEALRQGRVAGAALDCTGEEPLAQSSPLWEMENVLITPHVAGETRRYEDNVLDILMDNLNRLWRGEKTLINQVL